jgi:ferrous-iron efflux pump FieF
VSVDSKPTPSPQMLVRRAVVVCLFTTVTVAVAEILVGWWFGLLSVFAEGLHTAADLLDSVAAFALISIAHQPPDREHPYGHGKYDTVASLIGGLSVAGSGLYALFASGRILLGIDVGDPQPTAIAMAVIAATSVVYWFTSTYALRIASETKSPTAYSEAIHIRTHVYITAGLFIGIVLTAIFQQGGTGSGQVD